MIRRASSCVVVTFLALGAASLHCNPVLDVGHNVADSGTETSSSACNVNDGTCRPGEGCAPDECTRCVCDDTHTWFCSETCPDAGGECPPSLPKNGAPCTASTDVACAYENGCRERDFALCFAGSWEIYHGLCDPPPDCPRSPPPPGSPCHDIIPHCTWKNACGVSYNGACDGSRWILSPPPCTPGACPLTTPPDKSPCSSPDLKCEWANDCGTDDYGLCTDSGWAVKSTCAPMQCPKIPPAAGAPCANEGTKCSWNAGCEAGTYLEATCTSGAWVFAPGCR